MKIKLIYLVIVAIVLSIITSVSVYLFLYNIAMPEQLYEKIAIPMNIQIADFIGFDVNNSKLNFGAILPGGHSRRNITITNDFKNDIHVIMQFDGEIKNWISGYKEEFVLQEGESKELMLTVSPPYEIKKSNYTGTAYVTIYKTE
jgi:hypothetical protein